MISTPSAVSLTIAKFTKDKRIKAQLTTNEVAQALEVTEAQILAYEAGTQPIPIEDVIALSNALNIPPEEIVQLFYDLLGCDEANQFIEQLIS